MLYNICYITSNGRPYKQRDFCYVARCLLYNKKLYSTSQPSRCWDCGPGVWRSTAIPFRVERAELTSQHRGRAGSYDSRARNRRAWASGRPPTGHANVCWTPGPRPRAVTWLCFWTASAFLWFLSQICMQGCLGRHRSVCCRSPNPTRTAGCVCILTWDDSRGY